MSICPTFGREGPDGIAQALHKVDCLTSEATTASFGRLFGMDGQLMPALTILLTIYIALLALNLLTGRSALRVSMMTPRMLTLGLILTFVTSWIAYQSVVWNLAVGAPDQIAGILTGSDGSATMVFAKQLDSLFIAVANAAQALGEDGSAAASTGLASPANILWCSALILLLSTVGVLVVCRIALAALLILGPVFIVLALFEGTRGFFEGWLKAVVTFALVPLLTVVMGSGALVAILPMVDGLTEGGTVSLRTAVGILVASIVYLSLMLLVMELARTLGRGFRSRAQPSRHTVHAAAAMAHPMSPAAEASPRVSHHVTNEGVRTTSDRMQSTIASLSASAVGGPAPIRFNGAERLAVSGMPMAVTPLVHSHRHLSLISTSNRQAQSAFPSAPRPYSREKRS